MTEIVIEHKWKAKESEKVMKVVGDIMGMQKNSSLPEGFKLKSVLVLNGENRAICNWDAPDAKAMENLLAKVNPPTKHKVFEVTRAL